MTSTFKKFLLSLTILIVGGAILATTWWINGAERDDLWLYLISGSFILYAAYELFSGLNKNYKDK